MASSKPLSVLCISSDRPLLRQLGNLLRTFGYHHVSCVDAKNTASYAQIVEPSICIVDGANWDAARQAIIDLHPDHQRPLPYTILLWDDHSDLDPVVTMDLGIDDVLAKPIRHAEVLTRLRTGARVCELARRMTTVSASHVSTPHLTRFGLLSRLRQLGEKDQWAHTTALIVIELDLFAELTLQLGREAARTLEQSFAQNVHKLEPKALLARLDHGQLAVVVPRISLDEARKKAEELRKALTEKLQPRRTFSLGVALLEAGDQCVQDLMDRACQALSLAQLNGRDCVVASGDYDREQEQWQECVERGNPFASNSACDVMIPFTMWLTPDDSISSARERFDRTQLPLLPVWSDDDGFVGIVRSEQCHGTRKGKAPAHSTISAVQSDDFVRMDIDDDYDRVMRHFMNHRSTPIVLCRDDIPQGFVTCENLVAMVARIDEGTFQSTETSHNCRGFLVPDNPSPESAPALNY